MFPDPTFPWNEHAGLRHLILHSARPFVDERCATLEIGLKTLARRWVTRWTPTLNCGSTFNLPRDCVGCHRDDYNSGPTRNSTAPTVTSRRRCSSSPARPAMSTSGPKWTKNTRTSAGIRTTAGRATRAIRTAGAESLLVGCQCSAHRLQKISLMVRRFDACSRHVKRGCGSPP